MKVSLVSLCIFKHLKALIAGHLQALSCCKGQHKRSDVRFSLTGLQMLHLLRSVELRLASRCTQVPRCKSSFKQAKTTWLFDAEAAVGWSAIISLRCEATPAE